MKLNDQEIPVSAIQKYIPEGHSPKLFIEMLKQIMGVEKHRDGNVSPRPTEDFLLFLMTCKRVGLDPLAKQIYPIYRWNTRQGREVMTITTGIDGFRAIAERSGAYGGSDDAKFTVEEFYNPKKQDVEKDLVARVTVHKINPKTGELMHTTASAKFQAYVQKDSKGQPMGMWAGELMYNQLAKCAEALALRKAFPNDLSGLYIKEEMDQAETVEKIELPKPTINKEIKESVAKEESGEFTSQPAEPAKAVEAPKVEVK